MKLLNLKALKKIFTLFLTLALSSILFIGLDTPYIATALTSSILWFVFYPILIIAVFYFVYLKKDSRFNHKLLAKRLQQNGENKWLIKTIGFNFALLAPIILIYTLNIYLALVCDYFARQPFSEIVTLRAVNCDNSRRGHSNFNLVAINKKNNMIRINFPYSMCRDHLNIKRLNGQSIKLYGRQWVLGTVYDGFDFSKNIDIS
jgi:hypothetical protein